MQNHIKSFPRMTSHYSPLKRYLSPELNINQMYMLYIAKEEPQVAQRQREILTARQVKPLPLPLPIKPVVTRDRYYKIFNSNFNFGLGLPRKIPVSLVTTLPSPLSLIQVTQMPSSVSGSPGSGRQRVPVHARQHIGSFRQLVQYLPSRWVSCP